MLPPLTFVVILSMIKDAYEDFKRHREDRNENNALTEIYNRDSQCFETQTWSKVQVGDLVKVKDNSFFPADMVVLNSSEAEGTLYVETKNLDGETNLKTKSVARELVKTFDSEVLFG